MGPGGAMIFKGAAFLARRVWLSGQREGHVVDHEGSGPAEGAEAGHVAGQCSRGTLLVVEDKAAQD